MDERFHSYEPRLGHRLRHDPMGGIVGPRPIGWISSRDAQGRVNLAPYSFFNVFSYSPPIVGFASVGFKDTVRNVESTREFGWSLATRPLAQAMNATSSTVPSEVDEFDLAGLTRAPSRLIGAPRVFESPVSFECQVTQMLRLQGADGKPVNGWLVLGEVVAVYIDRGLLHDGIYDTTLAEPILRGGGPADYFTITDAARFLTRRPD